MDNDSREKKKQTASDVHSPQGLCASCVLAAECTFPRQPGRPVMCCEEFDGASLTPKKPLAPQPARDSAAQEPDLTGESRGLCRTCERKETCSYPKPEGGVWRCEEFQ